MEGDLNTSFSEFNQLKRKKKKEKLNDVSIT